MSGVVALLPPLSERSDVEAVALRILSLLRGCTTAADRSALAPPGVGFSDEQMEEWRVAPPCETLGMLALPNDTWRALILPRLTLLDITSLVSTSRRLYVTVSFAVSSWCFNSGAPFLGAATSRLLFSLCLRKHCCPRCAWRCARYWVARIQRPSHDGEQQQFDCRLEEVFSTDSGSPHPKLENYQREVEEEDEEEESLPTPLVHVDGICKRDPCGFRFKLFDIDLCREWDLFEYLFDETECKIFDTVYHDVLEVLEHSRWNLVDAGRGIKTAKWMKEKRDYEFPETCLMCCRTYAQSDVRNHSEELYFDPCLSHGCGKLCANLSVSNFSQAIR